MQIYANYRHFYKKKVKNQFREKTYKYQFFYLFIYKSILTNIIDVFVDKKYRIQKFRKDLL